jgi:4-diphosphocytidyl-2-C-methyl-D-erythritol kinase
MVKQLDWWPSPAKLNLFLHINGRYENGYHQLQSIFQLLDLGDELAFDINDSVNINLITPIEGVPNQDNLIVKAALLLQKNYFERTKVKMGCDIYLKKRLPMGGGIGGGSSNAATTLVALNFLWDCRLSDSQLAELGLQLGADVPIFVHGNSAFAEGVGEQLTPVNLPEKFYLVVFPDCHISTAAIFNADDLPRNTPKIRCQDYQFENTRNDCQELVVNLYPNVAKTLRWLLEYAPSRMTGTGACVFSVFDSEKDAFNVQAKLPKGTTSFVANGLSRSPLHDKLEAIKSQAQ